jgi:hypothetical protein
MTVNIDISKHLAVVPYGREPQETIGFNATPMSRIITIGHNCSNFQATHVGYQSQGNSMCLDRRNQDMTHAWFQKSRNSLMAVIATLSRSTPQGDNQQCKGHSK